MTLPQTLLREQFGSKISLTEKHVYDTMKKILGKEVLIYEINCCRDRIPKQKTVADFGSQLFDQYLHRFYVCLE